MKFELSPYVKEVLTQRCKALNVPVPRRGLTDRSLQTLQRKFHAKGDDIHLHCGLFPYEGEDPDAFEHRENNFFQDVLNDSTHSIYRLAYAPEVVKPILDKVGPRIFKERYFVANTIGEFGFVLDCNTKDWDDVSVRIEIFWSDVSVDVAELWFDETNFTYSQEDLVINPLNDGPLFVSEKPPEGLTEKAMCLIYNEIVP